MKPAARIVHLSIIVTAFVIGAVSVAHAGTASSSLTVSASVTNRCVISAANISLGEYLAADTHATSPLDGTGSVNVACTKNASATIGLSQGGNSATGSTDAAPLRQMAAGAERLRYDFFTDSGRSATWGNTVATSKGYTASSVSSSNITIYARVPAGQDVAAGSFSDTVTATITF